MCNKPPASFSCGRRRCLIFEFILTLERLTRLDGLEAVHRYLYCAGLH